MSNNNEQILAKLQAAGFLPEHTPAPSRYLELETAITNHCVDSDHPQVVWFDAEAITSDSDYARLCDYFITAIPKDLKITDIQSFYDYDNRRAGCSAKKRGKLIEASWEQQGDVVADEFTDYIKVLTNNRTEKFYQIHTGSMLYLALFLETDLYKALEAYRETSQKGRNEFLTGESERSAELFNRIPILPERESLRIIQAIEKTFLGDSKDFSNAEAYVGKAVAQVALVGRDDFFEAAQRLANLHLPVHFVMQQNHFSYEDLVPDEDCYFYSLDNPSLNVVFEFPAKGVPGRIAGERSNKHIGPYIIAGKAMEWAVYVGDEVDMGKGKPNAMNIICSGKRVLDLIEQHCIDIHANPLLKRLIEFVNSRLTPWFIERGYFIPPTTLNATNTAKNLRTMKR